MICNLVSMICKHLRPSKIDFVNSVTRAHQQKNVRVFFFIWQNAHFVFFQSELKKNVAKALFSFLTGRPVSVYSAVDAIVDSYNDILSELCEDLPAKDTLAEAKKVINIC